VYGVEIFERAGEYSERRLPPLAARTELATLELAKLGAGDRHRGSAWTRGKHSVCSNHRHGRCFLIAPSLEGHVHMPAPATSIAPPGFC